MDKAEIEKLQKENEDLKKELIVNNNVSEGLQNTITDLQNKEVQEVNPDLELQAEVDSLKKIIKDQEFQAVGKTVSGFVRKVVYKSQKRVK